MNISLKQPRLAVVFDFGGVLIEWNPLLVYKKYFHDDENAIRAFMEEVGFAEWNLQQDMGRPFAAAVEELSSRFPQYADLIQAYDKEWEASIAGPIQPTVGILYELKEAGYPLYGLSNWSEEKFQLVRPKYTFFDWFDDVLVSGEVKLVKPDPRIYTVFLERIGRSPAECLFVDDSQENIRVSSEMGFSTIRFRSPQQLRDELRSRSLLS
jgi:2-haloacid dehalogenase